MSFLFRPHHYVSGRSRLLPFLFTSTGRCRKGNAHVSVVHEQWCFNRGFRRSVCFPPSPGEYEAGHARAPHDNGYVGCLDHRGTICSMHPLPQDYGVNLETGQDPLWVLFNPRPFETGTVGCCCVLCGGDAHQSRGPHGGQLL